MQLNLGKKKVEYKVLEKLEAEIGRFKQAIETRKEIAKGGEDGIRAALVYLKNYRTNVQSLLMQCYYQTNAEKNLQANEYAGEINALNVVIDLFENPKSAIINYQTEMASLEKQLEDYKRLPRAD